MRRIKYPVGIQTFSEIREEGYLYVDKTEFVWQLTQDYKYVFLSRPRRFGKTLLASTIQCYFEGRKELFDGLAISERETEWIKYPTVRIDLSSGSYSSLDMLILKLDDILTALERELNITTPRNLLSSRLLDIIKELNSRSGRKVVLIIDEYDKPLLENIGNESAHEEIRSELRAFYTTIKEADEYLKFVFITGVTRFSRVSIFSGFNNLEDISLSNEFNAICGISKTEMELYFPESIKLFSVSEGIPEKEMWEKIRLNYDGYHFAQTGEDIYNPFSVLKAFKYKTIGTYWFDSGTPTFLIRLIRNNRYNLLELENAHRTSRQLGDVATMNTDIIPLLFQAGYLTIKGYDWVTEQYLLNFPNLEVSKSFWETLSNYFFTNRGTSDYFSSHRMTRALNEGRPDEAMEILKALFADTPPGVEKDKEVHFQNMTAIAFKMLGFEVRTEIHTSGGRCDMEVETDSYVYVIEFKKDSSAQTALEQILDRGYHLRHAAGSREVILIGANFSTRTGTLSDWLIKRM